MPAIGSPHAEDDEVELMHSAQPKRRLRPGEQSLETLGEKAGLQSRDLGVFARNRYGFLCAGCVLVTLLLLIARRVEPGARAAKTAGLEHVTANDLHGVHDLLLVGYAGVFLRDPQSPSGAAAAAAVRGAALDLARLLPILHPVPACRSALDAALAGSKEPTKQIVAAASAAWTCLPLGFSSQAFSATFSAEALHNRTLQAAARNPKLKPGAKAQLGSCRESAWDRTCSYWSALHVLAARAERDGKGSRFLLAYITAVFGGATLCKG